MPVGTTGPRRVHHKTDNTQTIVWRVETDPFGNEIGTSIKSVENNLRFPGQYYDAETGLNQNYFRDYDPPSGRYVEADQIGIRKGENHIYNYAFGNPLNYFDMDGLEPVTLPTVDGRINDINKRLRNNNWSKNGSSGQGEFGYVDRESAYPVIIVSPLLREGSCLKKCTIAHEQVHVEQYKHFWNLVKRKTELERPAYEAELECLKKCKNSCPNQ